MKKRYLFLALLIPFIFAGCNDVNFGVQEVRNTYLILNGVESSEVAVFCESEKLISPVKHECKEITDERTIDYLTNYGLMQNSSSFKVFEIPCKSTITDHKNVYIYFEVKVSNELYIGELNVSTLNTKSDVSLDSLFVKLESVTGKILPAIFTFDFHMTL